MTKPTQYVTVAGDLWDMVALKTMGSEKHTDKLMKANRSQQFIVLFPAGVTLEIPEIPADSMTGLPPWKGGKK